MKSILIDSDLLIEVSRSRDTDILARWDQLGRSDVPLLCSPVTVAELWHGARRPEHAALHALFAAIRTIPIDLTMGIRAGGYLRLFAKSHRLELGDALIAATVSVHNLDLWTRNRRHYPVKDVVFYR